MCLSVLAHAVPAGTRIENQASANFRNTSNGAEEQITSGTVTAVVQAANSISLAPSFEETVLPGSTSMFVHTLTNTGNLPDSVNLSLTNINNSLSSVSNVTLWYDINNNAVIDSTDEELALQSNMSLAANEARQIIVLIALSGNVQDGDEIQFSLSADGLGNTVFVIDELLVRTTTEVNVSAQPSVNVLASQSELSMNTSLSLNGAAPLSGTNILVNGQMQSLVVIETPLPSGVFLSRSLVAPEGYMALYRIAGTPPGSYTTVAPEDLSQVTAIAFAKPEVAPNESPVFEYFLEIRGEPREIIMWSTVRHANAEITADTVSIEITEDENGEGDSKALLVNNGVSTEESPMVLRTGNTMDIEFSCYSCNTDPDAYDTVEIEVVSQNTGDIERITLTETDFRSGIFSSSLLWLANLSDNPLAENDGSLSVTKNDWITVKVVTSDGRILEQKLLIDPAGYIFDSVTGNTIANAEVTLYQLNPDGSMSLADVFADAAGTIPLPNPDVTETDGYYEFPFVASGDYQLSVTRLPNGFRFPSTRTGEEMEEVADLYLNLWGYNGSNSLVQGQLITVADGPSYGNTFTVISQAVYIDIPVDPDYLFSDDDESRGIALNISADRRQAEIGESIGYTIDITNYSGNQLVQTDVRLDIPPGFQYLPGSTRWNAEALVDPVIENGQLVFALGSIESEAEVALNFRMIVTPTALEGNATIVARATGQGPAIPGFGSASFFSRKAHVKVSVDAGVFRNDGIITGKVFHDCNADGIQNNDKGNEPGIPGVRFYLQNGRYVETDSYGRYSFARLRPGTYIVKADTTNDMVTEWRLSQINSRSNRHDMIRVDLTDGELFRADFPLASCVTEEVESEAKSTGSSSVEVKSEVGEEDVTSITFPENGSRVSGRQTAINIEGPLEVTFEVSVNGKKLANDRLGKQTIDSLAGIQRLSFYAVSLQPGKNSIVAVGKDRWGNERTHDEIQVVRPGRLSKLLWVNSKAELLADNSQQEIRLELHDEHGEKIAGDTLVTIDTVDGDTLGMELTDTDLDAIQPGIQLVVVDGSRTIKLRTPSRSGAVTLQATAGSIAENVQLNFAPKLRNWVVAGLVESEYSEIENEGTGRAAIFAKGTVKDDYLVTMIVDTDKQEEDDWAGRPDLERDYPIYGDDAISGAEGESDKGLYLRIERDDSFALIGDFRPDQDSRRTRVGAYNRKLYGLQQHYEGEAWQFETFVARTSTMQIVDFLRARGTSGPFSLSKQAIVVNSESVEVITRARAPDGEIVATEPLRAFVDYEIDPVLGTIILRAPLSGTDNEGRPRYLRVSYNVDENNHDENDTVGADVNYVFSENLMFGARTVFERGQINDYSLSSLNGLYQISKSTSLALEYAQSENSGLDLNNDGDAINARLEHNSKSRQIRLNMNDSSKEFDNISASTTAGTQATEFRWQEHISEKQDLWIGLREFSNSETRVESNTDEMGITRRLSDNFKVGLSLEESKSETPLGESFKDTSMGAQAQYRPDWLKAASLDVRAYEALDTDRERQTISMDYQLPNNGSLALNWEHFEGYDVNGDLNEQTQSRQNWSAGYKQQVHSTTEMYSEYRLRDAADGVENSAATGMRFGYDIREGLRLIAQAERTLDLADNPRTPSRYSWALGLSGFESDESKWLVKLEMLAAEDRRWLQEVRWAKRFNEEWSVLTRERLQWRNSIAHYAGEITTGLAYRPVDNNKWDLMGRLCFF